MDESLDFFLTTLCEQGNADRLLRYPFLDIQSRVDDILRMKARNMLDVRQNPCYHNILFAWRLHRKNYRGGRVVFLLSGSNI